MLVFGFIAALPLMLAVIILRVVDTGLPAAKDQGQTDGQAGYLSLLRQPEFLKILVLGAVTYAPITTITGLWGGPFLQDVAGLSAGQSGAVLLLLFAATIAAGYVFGVLDRHTASRRWLICIALVLSGVSLLALATLARPPVGLTVALLVIMVFSQQFYIPLGAHMRKSVADALLGRASTLLSLVSVAAIPLMQLGFGAILDLAAAWGFAREDQYRAAFGAMGTLVLSAGLIYLTARNVNDAT